MRKPDLAAAIAEKADLSKDQANRVLNAVLDEITQALSNKDSVTLVGFGTFLQRHRGARTGKNPQTGAPVKIKASNTVPSSRAKACATRSTESDFRARGPVGPLPPGSRQSRALP